MLALPVDAQITRALTTSDRCTDSISDLDIDFEVWSELYDFSYEIAPDVGTFCGEVLIG